MTDAVPLVRENAGDLAQLPPELLHQVCEFLPASALRQLAATGVYARDGVGAYVRLKRSGDKPHVARRWIHARPGARALPANLGLAIQAVADEAGLFRLDPTTTDGFDQERQAIYPHLASLGRGLAPTLVPAASHIDEPMAGSAAGAVEAASSNAVAQAAASEMVACLNAHGQFSLATDLDEAAAASQRSKAGWFSSLRGWLSPAAPQVEPTRIGLSRLSNGDWYVGQHRAQAPHGYGLVLTPVADQQGYELSYEGEFQAGERRGRGFRACGPAASPARWPSFYAPRAESRRVRLGLPLCPVKGPRDFLWTRNGGRWHELAAPLQAFFRNRNLDHAWAPQAAVWASQQFEGASAVAPVLADLVATPGRRGRDVRDRIWAGDSALGVVALLDALRPEYGEATNADAARGLVGLVDHARRANTDIAELLQVESFVTALEEALYAAQDKDGLKAAVTLAQVLIESEPAETTSKAASRLRCAGRRRVRALTKELLDVFTGVERELAMAKLVALVAARPEFAAVAGRRLARALWDRKRNLLAIMTLEGISGRKQTADALLQIDGFSEALVAVLPNRLARIPMEVPGTAGNVALDFQVLPWVARAIRNLAEASSEEAREPLATPVAREALRECYERTMKFDANLVDAIEDLRVSRLKLFGAQGEA